MTNNVTENHIMPKNLHPSSKPNAKEILAELSKAYELMPSQKKKIFERIHQISKKYIQPGESLVDEFLAERNADEK